MNLLSAALIAIILLFSCAIAHLVTELEFFTLYGYLAGTDEVTSRLLRDGQFYVDRLYLKFPVSRVDVSWANSASPGEVG